MPIHTTHARDAALHKLRRLNRWLIAGSIALTGVLADVAANAFPGKTIKASTSKPKGAGRQSGGSSGKSSQSLKPPQKAPEASSGSAPSQESSAPSPESAAPSQEAAPPQESSASRKTRESAPPKESAPAPEASREAAPAPESSAPVVSGGS
jgi:hypothetical protein